MHTNNIFHKFSKLITDFLFITYLNGSIIITNFFQATQSDNELANMPIDTEEPLNCIRAPPGISTPPTGIYMAWTKSYTLLSGLVTMTQVNPLGKGKINAWQPGIKCGSLAWEAQTLPLSFCSPTTHYAKWSQERPF